MGRKALKTAGVGCGVVVLLVFVGVPTFVAYMGTSGGPCHEFDSSLGKIMRGARRYYGFDHRDPSGRLRPRTFPTNVKRTPASVPCGERAHVPEQVWEKNGWGPLGLGAYNNHHTYCTHDFIATGKGRDARCWARMECMLYCDQAPMVLEATGWIDDEGTFRQNRRFTNCGRRGRRSIEELKHRLLQLLTLGLVSHPDVWGYGPAPPQPVSPPAPRAGRVRESTRRSDEDAGGGG